MIIYEEKKGGNIVKENIVFLHHSMGKSNCRVSTTLYQPWMALC